VFAAKIDVKKRLVMPNVLQPETQRRIDMLFSAGECDQVSRLISESKLRGDRVCIAALKISHGNLKKLKEAIAIGEDDGRDLLLAAGFANDPEEHLRWMPGQVEKSWWEALIERFK
jgi:hypothetical protein